jgi:hypothetical protein
MRSIRLGFIALISMSTACGGESADIASTMPQDGAATNAAPEAGAPSEAGEPLDASSACGTATCAPDQFCARPEWQCGGSGTCTRRPPDCNDAGTAPVCGCDLKSYVSACKAERAGVSVSHQGGCAVRDGGDALCQTNANCDADEYCDYAGGCGTVGSGKGLCQKRPLTCSAPGAFTACGCDGKTYVSNCEAHRIGLDVRGVGPCDGG